MVEGSASECSRPNMHFENATKTLELHVSDNKFALFQYTRDNCSTDTEEFFLDLPTKAHEYYFNEKPTGNASCAKKPLSNTHILPMLDSNRSSNYQTEPTLCFTPKMQVPMPITPRAQKESPMYLKPRFQVRQGSRYPICMNNQHQEPVSGTDIDEFFLVLPTKAHGYYFNEKPTVNASCAEKPLSNTRILPILDSNRSSSYQTEPTLCFTPKMQIQSLFTPRSKKSAQGT